MGSTPAGGEPAGMIARQVRYRITKQAADLEVFREALYSGMLRMDRGTFEFYQDLLREWGGEPQQADRIR